MRDLIEKVEKFNRKRGKNFKNSITNPVNFGAVFLKGVIPGY